MSSDHAPPKPPPRKRSDYWAYYYAQCAKCAPRTIDWDHHAYEAVLGLLMFDYPEKTESIASSHWPRWACMRRLWVRASQAASDSGSVENFHEA